MAAAEQVAKSGLLWKWVSYDGTIKLVRWDAAEQVFLRGSLNDWYHFFGTHFVVKDGAGREFLGPPSHASVCRLPVGVSSCNGSGRRPNEHGIGSRNKAGIEQTP
jgi:hypothetical protein